MPPQLLLPRHDCGENPDIVELMNFLMSLMRGTEESPGEKGEGGGERGRERRGREGVDLLHMLYISKNELILWMMS